MAQVVVHRLAIVLDKIRAVGGGAPAYMSKVLGRVMSDDIWPAYVEHISLQDHSLEDLRKLGHPYAIRFGVDSFIHPDSEVHEQGGSLSESSHIVMASSGGMTSAKIICTSPHYIFLRYGTRFMRMRDPGGAALIEALPKIRKRFATEVKAAIVKIYVG
jgi:hypothetical protein